MNGRIWILKQNDERTGGDHEQTKFKAFQEILRPMNVEGREDLCAPGNDWCFLFRLGCTIEREFVCHARFDADAGWRFQGSRSGKLLEGHLNYAPDAVDLLAQVAA